MIIVKFQWNDCLTFSVIHTLQISFPKNGWKTWVIDYDNTRIFYINLITVGKQNEKRKKLNEIYFVRKNDKCRR